jgi:acetolactate decarboxylase
MVKWYHLVILILVALIIIAGAVLLSGSGKQPDRDVLYQVSAMDLLKNGSYDGFVTVGEVKSHGDFGMGTFDRLDGEAITVNGTIYQARSDGTIHVMNDSDTMPFAVITFFDADRSVRLNGPINYSILTTMLDNELPSKNVFYAIRIHDTFPYLKVRSPPAQSKPYPSLSVALLNQSVFELHNVTGTIVGIYSPQYAGGVESAGYHFHFVADDHNSGGHVLDIASEGLTAQLDETPGFYMSLPAK